MQQSKEVNVNWLRINVPSIAAVVLAAITITVYIQRLEARLDVIEQSRQARSVVSDKAFDEIQDKLKPLGNVVFRLDQQDKRDDAQDIRIDRLLDIMGAKFDALTQSVAEVKSDVRVLSQKIDTITQEKKAENGKTQPTIFHP